MVIPIIILVSIPVFLGIVYIAPFEQPEEIESEEHDVSILYFILMGIWTLYLIKIIFQIKKSTFRTSQKY